MKKPRCPDCGYDLSGAALPVARDDKSTVVCSECGSEVLLCRQPPRWLFEYGNAGRCRKMFVTFIRAAWPPRFWNQVESSVPTRTSRLLAFHLAIIVALHSVICIATAFCVLITLNTGWPPVEPTWSGQFWLILRESIWPYRYSTGGPVGNEWDIGERAVLLSIAWFYLSAALFTVLSANCANGTKKVWPNLRPVSYSIVPVALAVAFWILARTVQFGLLTVYGPRDAYDIMGPLWRMTISTRSFLFASVATALVLCWYSVGRSYLGIRKAWLVALGAVVLSGVPVIALVFV